MHPINKIKSSPMQRINTDEYDQFKTGDEKLVNLIQESNHIVYDNQVINIGLYWSQRCKCSAATPDFKIRDTFFCDGCKLLHQLHCSAQEPAELIANDYFRTENCVNLCLDCKPINHHSTGPHFTNEIKEATKRCNNSILVAVNNDLAIDRPIIKKSKGGRRFVVHQQVGRHSSHPTCFCHQRTYLAPHDYYFTCADCKETHYYNCDESPVTDVELFISLMPDYCDYCESKRRQERRRLEAQEDIEEW